jgi:sugar lactone lactonase YvrE
MFSCLPWFSARRYCRASLLFALIACLSAAGADLAAQTAHLSNPLGGSSFGSVAVGTTTSPVTLTFTFDSGGAIHPPDVLTLGVAKLDFRDAQTGTCTTNGSLHQYSQGDTCTLDVRFSPKSAGARFGAAVLSDTSGNPIATAYVYGTGIAPLVAFSAAESSIAGHAAVALNQPWGVAADGNGNLYVADTGNSRVLKVPSTDLSCTTASDCVAIGSSLSFPDGVAVDGAGNIFIADGNAGGILKETPLGGGGYAQSFVASVGTPRGVAVDGSGNLYIVANGETDGVLKGTFSAGSYSSSVIPVSNWNYPQAVAADVNGNVYVANTGGNAVVEEALQPGGSYIENTVASISGPNGVAVDNSGNVYIVSSGGSNVVKETPAGNAYIASTITSGLLMPHGVAVDARGDVYVADYGNNRILREDVVTPPSLSFAATQVGSQSSDSPQSFSVFNIGNAKLTFTAPSSVPSGFAIDAASNCPQIAAVAPGASCSFAVDFTPVATGSNSGSMAVVDNNLNAAGPSYANQFIPLSGTGTGVAPHITQNPSGQAVAVQWPATFYAAASGAPAPTVQWQQSVDSGSTWSDIGGATTTTLSFLAAHSMNGYEYRAVFTNVVGTATTRAATLTIVPNKGGGAPPCPGGSHRPSQKDQACDGL